MYGAAFDSGNPAQVVFVLCVIPTCIGIGLWIVCRPASAFRRIYWYSRRSPSSGELLWFRLFGVAFTGMAIAAAIAFLTDVISN